jgi:exodeoxyribonuclease-1
VPAPSPEHIQRAEVIAQSPDFRDRVGKALAARFPEDPAAPPPPVERQIFNGFYTQADKDVLHAFQRADWPQRLELVASLKDARLQDLGRRLVALHAHGLLSPEAHSQFDAWLRDRWSAPDEPGIEWTGLTRARAALADLRGRASVDPELLGDIDAYLQGFAAN